MHSEFFKTEGVKRASRLAFLFLSQGRTTYDKLSREIYPSNSGKKVWVSRAVEPLISDGFVSVQKPVSRSGKHGAPNHWLSLKNTKEIQIDRVLKKLLYENPFPVEIDRDAQLDVALVYCFLSQQQSIDGLIFNLNSKVIANWCGFGQAKLNKAYALLEEYAPKMGVYFLRKCDGNFLNSGVPKEVFYLDEFDKSRKDLLSVIEVLASTDNDAYGRGISLDRLVKRVDATDRHKDLKIPKAAQKYWLLKKHSLTLSSFRIYELSLEILAAIVEFPNELRRKFSFSKASNPRHIGYYNNTEILAKLKNRVDQEWILVALYVAVAYVVFSSRPNLEIHCRLQLWQELTFHKTKQSLNQIFGVQGLDTKLNFSVDRTVNCLIEIPQLVKDKAEVDTIYSALKKYDDELTNLDKIALSVFVIFSVRLKLHD